MEGLNRFATYLNGMNKAILYALASIFFLNCQEPAQIPRTFKDLSVEEFKSLIASNPGQILDVRTMEEIQTGMIDGASHIDFYSADFEAKLSALQKDQPVYVYCAAGGRSGKAMKKMMELEFTEVYNLDGGMGAWKAEGMDTVLPH